LDLWPNTSLRNPAIDPPGQTKYVSYQTQNDTVVTDGGRVTTAAYDGLAAYLLDNVVSGGVGGATGALSDVNANAAALAIVTGMQAGHAMTESDLDTYLTVVVANTGIATGASTGVVTEVLAILSGEIYTVPITSDMEVGGVKTARCGAFGSPSRVRRTYDGLALNASCAEGKLSYFKAATFEYLDVVHSALVVYSNTGLVM
jgi:hypothetical protein